VLEKLLFGAEIENTIFDFDDGVYLNYKDIWLGPFGRRAKFGYYARKAGFITVGSEAIGSEMQSLGCRRIAKVPSTVCVGSYSIHQHLALSTVIVGWIGTPKTVRFLDALRDVLPVVAKRCPFKMHVVGAEWDCRGVDVLSLPWSEDTETAMVGRFDIGLMPLIDGPWERAKCGYKLIQYMAAGVVPIGARIGENEVIIQDGVNGYLASEPEEWIKKLLILCGNHQLRSAVGARARETVLAKYDVRIAADAVHEVFTQVVNRQTRSA
jgi:glycosyltransferase involved in cell wall biosynthesis